MNKIMLSSYCDGYNFGSLLQCYALKYFLKSNGYEAILCSNKKLKKIYFIKRGIIHPIILNKFLKNRNNSRTCFSDIQNKMFETFIKESNVKVLSYRSHKKMANSSEIFACITGSDQVWNSESLFVSPFYFLSYSPYYKNIAYAPSFGRNFIPNYNFKTIERKLKNIRFISTREIQNKSLLERVSHRSEISICCDPVFLLTKDEWQKFGRFVFEKDYVVCYLLNIPFKDVLNCIISRLNKMKKHVIFVGDCLKSFKKEFDFTYKFICIDVLNFPDLVFNSSLVITDSFHGLAFSIIGNKKVLLVDRNYKSNMNQNVRIESLLLSCNYIINTEYNGVKEIEFFQQNYSELSKFIFNSKHFLLGSLKIIEHEQHK